MKTVKNTVTGKAYKIEDGQTLKAAEVYISKEEYKEIQEKDTNSVRDLIRPNHKKIFGECTEADYKQFIQRAKREGLEPDDAFKAIVTAYANGAVLTVPKNKKVPENFYVQAHK